MQGARLVCTCGGRRAHSSVEVDQARGLTLEKLLLGNRDVRKCCARRARDLVVCRRLCVEGDGSGVALLCGSSARWRAWSVANQGGTAAMGGWLGCLRLLPVRLIRRGCVMSMDSAW